MPDVDPHSSSQPSGGSKSARTFLTTLSHGSAPFITTFVLIHLSAPVLANLGGSSLSSQVMLLGREYYQTSFGEKFLVLTPLVLHPVSSIAKRFLSPKPSRRLQSVLSITGYAALISIPMHFLAHRYFPSDPSPPIHALGPAELDYEYVKYALHEWPWRSFFAYLALTAVVARHAAEGMGVIWNTWLRKRLGGSKGNQTTAGIMTAAIILPVASGLFVLSQEPRMVFTSTIPRFQAAFSKSLLYSLF
ncbi:hypothetical protein IEO21_00524 [Rhodonia placenta]|uniref:Mitochondrial adapter protein MCP1 transmembrane domain-containing protein n=1 Tax=Rhodonia placenta TaxID=104341 RepID=A0A8H7PBH0_9APHY|nr:hypothetical protein IEO21_00524 [Postia placenta]